MATRRSFLGSLALGAAGLYVPPAVAGTLIRTPRQTEGPFYPDRLPLDSDNDLVIVGQQKERAVGEITNLTGRILDAGGNPVKDALVEIWQVDVNGVYLHSSERRERDGGFQGFGRFQTGSSGEYRFRTIKPVPYSGRTPHIHFKVSKGSRELLTTQCYVRGEAQNDRDGVLRSIRDPRVRESVIVDFAKVPASKSDELAARFDIVLGLTPTQA